MAGQPLRISSTTWMLVCEAMGAAASGFGELAAAQSVEFERRAEYAKKAAACERLFELLPSILGRTLELKAFDESDPDYELCVDLKSLEMQRAGGIAAWMRLVDTCDLTAGVAR